MGEEGTRTGHTHLPRKALKARPRAGIRGEERGCQSRALGRETHL